MSSVAVFAKPLLRITYGVKCEALPYETARETPKRRRIGKEAMVILEHEVLCSELVRGRDVKEVPRVGVSYCPTIGELSNALQSKLSAAYAPSYKYCRVLYRGPQAPEPHYFALRTLVAFKSPWLDLHCYGVSTLYI